ncbi:hypothetical protein [Ostreiculturibacter nitratireducens]|uniref:hypothetical protein n=1 Tax=Ostreiculturibacter nitratireducens TaxID=3075226 RepID=UPI0031B57C00
MPRLLPLAATLALGLAALPAEAFIAQNDMNVSPEGGGFHVAFKAGAGVNDYWCAAGDYVIRDLGLSRSTRIWRVSPPPRRAGEGISFSLTPEGAARSTGLAVYPETGSLPAHHAEALCWEPKIEED